MTIEIVISIYSFLKEFFYGKTKDRRKQSLAYKIKSFIIIFLLTSSLTFNWYLSERTYSLGKKYVYLSKQYKTLQIDNEKLSSCEIENLVLKGLINKCVNKHQF